jgi:hypothetical protein
LAPLAAPTASPAAPAATGKGSPLIKIVIAVVAVIFVFGAVAIGGVYYLVYRVKEKVQEVKAEVLGGSASNSDTATGSGSTANGNTANGNSAAADTCRLLSREEVGHAIGVEIVATQAADGGCSYMAKGNSADMTAKHMAALVRSKGGDAKAQQMIQGFAGGIFKASQSETHQETSDANGNVPVLTFAVDNNAETLMQLNEKVLSGFGAPDPPIEGIGDHAFTVGESMMMVRKGDKLLRITYTMCPCNTDAIKPLAKTLANRL